MTTGYLISLSASVKPDARRSALRYATSPSADIDQSPVTGSSTTISRAIVQRDRWATGDLDSHRFVPLVPDQHGELRGLLRRGQGLRRGHLRRPSAEQGRGTSSSSDQRGDGQCAQRPPPAGATLHLSHASRCGRLGPYRIGTQLMVELLAEAIPDLPLEVVISHRFGAPCQRFRLGLNPWPP